MPTGHTLCPASAQGKSAAARFAAKLVLNSGIMKVVLDAMKGELLALRVPHSDETPAVMLAPGTGKTSRAYIWACAGMS